MKPVPLTLAQANYMVWVYHRHHKPVVGHKFSVGAVVGQTLVGVAICGRPVARCVNQNSVLEVLRLVTDGEKNACSFLYSTCARVAKDLGYSRIQTYILADEPGTSLAASGWVRGKVVKGRSWSCESRPREDKHPTCDKVMWYKDLGQSAFWLDKEMGLCSTQR